MPPLPSTPPFHYTPPIHRTLPQLLPYNGRTGLPFEQLSEALSERVTPFKLRKVLDEGALRRGFRKGRVVGGKRWSHFRSAGAVPRTKAI